MHGKIATLRHRKRVHCIHTWLQLYKLMEIALQNWCCARLRPDQIGHKTNWHDTYASFSPHSGGKVLEQAEVTRLVVRHVLVKCAVQLFISVKHPVSGVEHEIRVYCIHHEVHFRYEEHHLIRRKMRRIIRGHQDKSELKSDNKQSKGFEKKCKNGISVSVSIWNQCTH